MASKPRTSLIAHANGRVAVCPGTKQGNCTNSPSVIDVLVTQSPCRRTLTHSKVSIKHHVLLNDLVWIFHKVSIKWPGPSQKKSIVLFYLLTCLLSLLNDLGWIFGKRLPGLIIRTLEYLVGTRYYLPNMCLCQSIYINQTSNSSYYVCTYCMKNLLLHKSKVHKSHYWPGHKEFFKPVSFW